MINRSLIQLVMLFSPVLRAIGVDTHQLKIILQTKCMVDDRRPRGLHIYGKSNRKRSSEKAKNIALVFFGVFLSSILFVGNLLMAHALFLTVFMVYLISSLLTDFSEVLIDVRDHYFIISRPVNDKTVATARIFHILIYLSKMFIPVILPGIIVVFIKSGATSGLIFFVELASAATISVFSVHIIYMLMLQFITPQTFRDMLAYFQIAFSTLIFAGYIILPQFLQRADMQHIIPTDYWISFILPPVWIATLQNWAVGNVTPITYFFSALAFIMPAICLIAVVRFLSGNYNNKLSMMGSASGIQKKDEPKNRSRTYSLSSQLAQLCTISPLEQLGFKITWKLTSRINKFKSRVYPSFAYIPLYFFYWAFINTSDRSLADTWHQLPQTSFYLFILYSIGFISIVITRQITKSEKFKAAWFYQISPTEKPGHVLSGMIKAIFVKYLLPSAILAILFILWIWGIGKWLNIVFALINLLLITIVMALIKARKFPFSEPSNLNQQKGQRFLNIFLILIPLGLGYFQSFIAEYSLLLIILSVTYTAISWGLYRMYKNIGWKELLDE